MTSINKCKHTNENHNKGSQMTPEFFKQEIKKQKLSQLEVANAIGCSRISLNRYLNGVTDFGASNVLKLIDKLGMKVYPQVKI
jgi:transcriptional regulator with XRE-family HTH domain